MGHGFLSRCLPRNNRFFMLHTFTITAEQLIKLIIGSVHDLIVLVSRHSVELLGVRYQTV